MQLDKQGFAMNLGYHAAEQEDSGCQSFEGFTSMVMNLGFVFKYFLEVMFSVQSVSILAMLWYF